MKNKRNNLFLLIAEYLLYHIKVILLFLTFIVILFAVYFLYDLEPAPAFYSAVLIIALAALFGIHGFLRLNNMLKWHCNIKGLKEEAMTSFLWSAPLRI